MFSNMFSVKGKQCSRCKACVMEATTIAAPTAFGVAVHGPKVRELQQQGPELGPHLCSTCRNQICPPFEPIDPPCKFDVAYTKKADGTINVTGVALVACNPKDPHRAIFIKNVKL